MTIAMYLRLSREDDDSKKCDKDESESIGNQRKLLLAFIHEKSEFFGAELLEFCDDGWSGKDFERPAFISMLEQVKKGAINCILVKDLSRFGRNYLIVGDYVSRVFPFLGVRLIGVNDNFDSSRPEDVDSLATAFKTLIYDLYSRELSEKVKAAKRQQAQKGLFLNPFAPYGYIKEPENRHHLLVDETAAKVVRRIFEMFSDGHRCPEIAATFNREGILTPMLYKRAAGCTRSRWPSIHEDNYWTPGILFKMLRDERYIGNCVYGKRERDMVGLTHSVKNARKDWIVVDGTHEGIISKELFFSAQALMKEHRERSFTPSLRNPLKGKVFCGACGYAMDLTHGKNVSYICRNANLEMGYGCSGKAISQAEVNEAVTALIRTYAQYAVDFTQLAILQTKRRQENAKRSIRELAALQSRKSQLEKRLQDLYEKLIDGDMDKGTYLSQKQSVSAQIEEISEQIAVLEKMRRAEATDDNVFISTYRGYTELQTLTFEIAQELVESVMLHSDGTMEITLNCLDELQSLTKEADDLSKVL